MKAVSTRLAAALLLACATGAWAAPSADAAPVLAAASASAAAAAPQAAFDLDADVNRVLKTFDVPGIAIAIVKDGKVVAAKGYGVRRLGEPAPVTGRTLFEVASNSKAFTAAALAMLVDEGKLKWDDPVTKHLPGFQMYDAYVTGAMTVRDLLTHRSGLGLGAGDLMWWPTTTFTSDEIIDRLRYLKPATSFRNSYAYDNLLYIVAGKIIASKAGKSWGEAVRERILAPLGMDGSTTSVAEMLRSADYAAPHSKVGETTTVVKPMPVENAAGAVGINTSAEDMARWMTMLLNGGKAPDGRQLVSDKQLREMWTAQTPMKITEPKPPLAATRPNFAAYGLGFQLRDYRGRKVALHGGALQGFYSRVLLVPEEKLGIAILTNAENSGSMAALQWRLLDQYLNAPATDWIGIVSADEQAKHQEELAKVGKASSARAAGSQPSLPLAAYEGEYQDPWYGLVTITREGRKQVMRFAKTPDLVGELEHFQHDSFIVRWRQRNFNADAYVSFALNPDGSIERVKMKPVSAETDFSYDFQDLNLTPVPQK
ncbi:serine hydrolase [Massilia sp. Root418]|jgi:CubicO group peptidase (beta-lactamase class C family)|uniref:serine hydrolase n=1 Tax=Massilia sp. Root418 TaxID=1736532 RepID=UPI0006F58383|nr:serine hydrolase [Massilia sp. Root418]KQX00211.1 serine hydrolase [Massilia sp. Root418]